MTTTTNQDTDIEKFRSAVETDKEWLLKRSFIEKHYGTFTEARLICLAQCYVNVETLGCVYPQAVMEQLRELTEDLKHENVDFTKGKSFKFESVAKTGVDKRKRKRMLRKITYKKFKKDYTEDQFGVVFNEFIETVNPFESIEYISTSLTEFINK